jgi:PAS domain S-box-containing protein
VVTIYRILYVDDEPGLLELGKLFLEQSGQFSVDTSTTVTGALTLLTSQTYDAILSDYQMPDMDGIEFLKAVRASGNPIPFIIFTGRGREDVVIQAMNEGAEYYVQKGGDPASQFAEIAYKIRQTVNHMRAEASIRDHERRESDIINFLPDATFAIDTHGVVIAWNRAMEKMTGILAWDMLNKGNHEYAIPFYGERRKILIDLTVNEFDPIDVPYENVQRTGDILIAESHVPGTYQGKGAYLWGIASPLYDNQNRVVGAIESIRDISDRKRSEDLLRESEEFLRSIVENIPLMLFVKDAADLRFVRFNKAGEDLLGYPREDLIGKNDYDLFPKEIADIFTSKDREVLGKQIPLDIPEEIIETRVLGTRMLHTRKIPVFDGDGNPRYLLGISEDITEQKKLEEDIRTALREKEILLKEIHHRVKNNIQVIASLLSIQSRTIEDKNVREVLREAQNRVKSIALVHEKLYQSKSLDRIDYNDYLQKISRHLYESYGISPRTVVMNIHAENISLHIDKAIPCSLIINELLSNAFKHAFPDGRKGDIWIDIHRDGDVFVVQYRDNGVGFPKGILSLEHLESLGMQLVYGLTRQLDGTIAVRGTEGTSITITFPV